MSKIVLDKNNYTFDSTNKQITLLGIGNVNILDLLSITNRDTNDLLFDCDGNGNQYNGRSATITNNIITLDFNTSQMNDTDDLCIKLDADIFIHALDEFVRLNGRDINEIDYTSVRELIINLQRSETFNKGKLIKVDYYEDYDHDNDVGTNHLIRVDVVYVDGIDTLVDSRTTTRTWMKPDGNDGVKTVSIKKYSTDMAIKEGVSRRKNIMNKMKVSVPGLIIQTENLDPLINLGIAQTLGRKLFKYFGNDTTEYIEVMALEINDLVDSAPRITGIDVDQILWQTGNIIRYTFNGSPDLSTIVIGEGINVDNAANANNNGVFIITAVDDTAKHIEITNPNRSDATDDETTNSVATVDAKFWWLNNDIGGSKLIGTYIKEEFDYITYP